MTRAVPPPCYVMCTRSVCTLLHTPFCTMQETVSGLERHPHGLERYPHHIVVCTSLCVYFASFTAPYGLKRYLHGLQRHPHRVCDVYLAPCGTLLHIHVSVTVVIGYSCSQFNRTVFNIQEQYIRNVSKVRNISRVSLSRIQEFINITFCGSRCYNQSISFPIPSVC